MHSAQPAKAANPTRPTQKYRRRDKVRIGSAIAFAVTALAAGVAIADLDHNTVGSCMRLAAAVAVILLGVCLVGRRVCRRLRRIEAQLADSIDAEHELYVRAYMDGLGRRGE